MRHNTFTNFALALSLLFGLAFACGDDYPSDQTVITLVKRDLSQRVGYFVDVKDVRVIGTNDSWEENNYPHGTRRIYPVYVEVTVKDGSSPSRYKCQFYKDDKDWVLGYVGDVDIKVP